MADTKKKTSKGEMPARNKKNFRPTKSGAGMTEKGVAAYRRKNPGSKLKKAVRMQSGVSLIALGPLVK
jgi:hypothetical protein